MADKKFSEFPLVVSPVPADVTVVGLDSLGQNAQFPGDSFGGVTVHGNLTGRSDADQHPISAVTGLQTALDGKEASLGNPASNGYILSSTTGGVRSWVPQPTGTSPLTTKGDIYGFGSADARVPVGTNGQVLTADSAQTLGVKWATPASAPVTSVAGETGVVTADQLRTNMSVIDPFSYKPTLATPIFILVTGQSNVDDIEEAVTDFAFNSHVFDYAWQTPYGGAGTQGTNPAVGFDWENPNPADAITTAPPGIGPDVGYRRGGTGAAGYAMANALQIATGRDVYVLKVCFSGTPISQWQGGGSVKNLLDSFVPYVLALPELVDVDWPDIVLWGQSEGNALATYSPANYLAPLAYKDAWLGVYNYADGVWWDNSLTRVYCIEPTQYFNWSGTAGGGALVDVPARWEGINAVERWAPDNVTMVSSVGIPWVTSVGPYAGSATYIHFTGDGCNQYGERIADIVLGKVQAKGLSSSQLYRELNPVLGGNLDANSKTITSASNITATAATITTATSDLNNTKRIQVTQANDTFTADPTYTAVQVSGATMTYNYFGGLTGQRFKAGNTHVFSNAGGVSNTGYSFNAQETVKNTGGVALALLGGLIGFRSANTLSADAATVTPTITGAFVSEPVFSAVNAGTLTVGVAIGFNSTASVTGNTTGTAVITNHIGFNATNCTTAAGGSVTSQSGFASALTVAGATNTTHLLLGTSTIPTGANYAIYQSDTLQSRFNGNITMASGSLTLTSGSITASAGSVTAVNAALTTPTAEITALATTFPLDIGGTTTYNWTSPAAPEATRQANFTATHIFKTAGAAVPARGTVDVRNTYKNFASNAVAMSLQGSFWSTQTYTADTQIVTAVTGADITSAPSFGIANSGTLGVISYINYNATAAVGTGATVTGSIGFYSGPATGSGTVTGRAGFVSNVAAANTTNNTHLLLGTTTVPSGNFAIYQSDALVNRWGGGHRYAYRTTSATSVTVTVADTIVAMSSTSTVTCNMPDAATCTGFVIHLKKTGASGTINVTSTGGQTFDTVGSPIAFTTANGIYSLFSDGANWRVLKGPGAP